MSSLSAGGDVKLPQADLPEPGLQKPYNEKTSQRQGQAGLQR